LPNELLYKLGRFIPYFEKVRQEAEISLKDLLPHVSLESLGTRGPLWESTLKLIADNPLIGISNGGFRLADDCSCYRGNTHNILFQSAIDAGALGVIVISLILGFTIAKGARDKWTLSLILGIVATLMVDNFTDHSYAWIVIASFTGVMLYRQDQHKSAQTDSKA
jgi:O-antigen ligase